MVTTQEFLVQRAHLARGRGGSGVAAVTFLRDWPNAALVILLVAAVVAVAF